MTLDGKPFREKVQLQVRRVGIVTKKDDVRPDAYAATLEQWLENRGIDSRRNDIQADLDMVIVLGGDGTLLHIAEKAAQHAIPVLGINLGNLGFLTELTEDETFTAIEHILRGEVIVENRLMLKARTISADRPGQYRYGLNDVVINKNVLDRLLHLATTIDQEYITTYKADGLIFSSPTGSTAYNLSAGGPLVYPGLTTITVTPICPFMLSSRPIILPADKLIHTRFIGRDNTEKAQVIIDGQAVWQLRPDDILEVAAAKHPLRLIVSSKRNYFTILRNKLHWGVSNESNPGE